MELKVENSGDMWYKAWVGAWASDDAHATTEAHEIIQVPAQGTGVVAGAVAQSVAAKDEVPTLSCFPSQLRLNGDCVADMFFVAAMTVRHP